MDEQQLWDVVAVNIATKAERVMERRLPETVAESYIEMAVRRRGVDEEFFKRVPSTDRSEPR